MKALVSALLLAALAPPAKGQSSQSDNGMFVALHLSLIHLLSESLLELGLVVSTHHMCRCPFPPCLDVASYPIVQLFATKASCPSSLVS